MSYIPLKYKSHIYWYSPTFLLQEEAANNEKQREAAKREVVYNEKQREADNKKEQVNAQDTGDETPPGNGDVPKNINENVAVPVKEPPKLHFDDGVGVIPPPEGDKKDENNDNLMEGMLVSDPRTFLLI